MKATLYPTFTGKCTLRYLIETYTIHTHYKQPLKVQQLLGIPHQEQFARFLVAPKFAPEFLVFRLAAEEIFKFSS